MRRLANTLLLDVRLQWRNGFYVVSMFVVAVLILVLRQFFTEGALSYALPTICFFAISGTTWMYAGGMVLLERSEAVLDGLWVTPLRLSEYLASKLITLTLLAAMESAIMIVLVYGEAVAWHFLAPGMILMGLLYTLGGFIVVARTESVPDFVVKTVWFLIPVQLPFLGVVGLWETPLFYLWPSQPALLLIWGGFHPLAPWQVIYAVVYGGAITVALYFWALATFRRRIVLGHAGGIAI